MADRLHVAAILSLLLLPPVYFALYGRRLEGPWRRVFVIGYNTPCTPHFMFVRDVIRRQRFGKLEMVSGYLAQNWLRYTNGTWRQDPSLSGGGQTYDSGAHLLSSLCWSVSNRSLPYQISPCPTRYQFPLSEETLMLS